MVNIYSCRAEQRKGLGFSADTECLREGKQSLRFGIKESDPGGRVSPGFMAEFLDKSEGTCKLSFGAMKKGTESKMVAGCVGLRSSRKEMVTKQSDDDNDGREYFEHVGVDEGTWFRLDFSILKAGTFGIDEIQIRTI